MAKASLDTLRAMVLEYGFEQVDAVSDSLASPSKKLECQTARGYTGCY